jgi:hypothetical protein
MTLSVVEVLKPMENVPEPSYVANVELVASVNGPAVWDPELNGPGEYVNPDATATLAVVNDLINSVAGKLNPGSAALRLKLVCVVPVTVSGTDALFFKVIVPFIPPEMVIATLVSSPVEGLN